MKYNFKVGDRVEWASGGYFTKYKGSNNPNLYDIGTIIDVTTTDLFVKWDSNGYVTSSHAFHLRLLEENKKEANPNRHIHADVIIAWANGAEIELYDEGYEEWLSVVNPKWDENIKYRVKPKELVEEFNVIYNIYAKNLIVEDDPNVVKNLRLTFEPDTGKLLKAEII